jgi:coenzyme F390 synthetase
MLLIIISNKIKDMEGHYFNSKMETLPIDDIESIVEERIRYTVEYAQKHSPFYRKWFFNNQIDPKDIRSHEDLLELPIISSGTIRENQPPKTNDFAFKSVSNKDIFTVHETSGTSGIPKSFFLTWSDWERYAEKYARAFISQGFGENDTVIVCATYGKNVGANTMTLAAKEIGMTIIPEGRCNFPTRVIESYKPTGIVGNFFKLLNLARRLQSEGIDPSDLGINRLVIGGESFAEESRAYVEEIWGCPVYNIYGSTEGTMCGECTEKSGLHVPEDLVHLDLYDPGIKEFISDGECGRMVLTSLIPVGEKAGTLLLNYDTEDTTVVVSREKCGCGRTHMKITNPQREAETFWIEGSPFNRVDVEKGVFQKENLESITGEYESVIRSDGIKTTLHVGIESSDMKNTDTNIIRENFVRAFIEHKPLLREAYEDNRFDISLDLKGQKELDIFKKKGRPKRVVDRR